MHPYWFSTQKWLAFVTIALVNYLLLVDLNKIPSKANISVSSNPFDTTKAKSIKSSAYNLANFEMEMESSFY